MAVHINASRTSMSQTKKVKIHHMPCLIKHDGEANASKYLEPTISTSEAGVLTASFRGRSLLGKEVEIQKNYDGVVLQETREELNEDFDRNVYVTGIFDKFNYWNYDRIPSSKDQIISAMDWLDISSALHSPVDD